MDLCGICHQPGKEKSHHNWKLHSEYWYNQAKKYDQLNRAVREAFNEMANRGLDFDFMRDLAEVIE